MDTDNIKIYGDPAAEHVFIQLVDDHDLEVMDSEAAQLRSLTGRTDWCIAAVPVDDWWSELTPWPAPAAFGKQDFGDGAEQTLKRLQSEVLPQLAGQILAPQSGNSAPATDKHTYYLCGYSLAGLFALWAAYQTDAFAGVVAASPSVWYRDWIGYAESHTPQTSAIYLSLGDKEPKTRNPVMATVGDAIRHQSELLTEAGIAAQLDFNPGNHFVDSDLRVAKGIAWLLTHTQSEK